MWQKIINFLYTPTHYDINREQRLLKNIIYTSILASTLVLIPTLSYGATYGSNFLTGSSVTACAYYDANYTPDKTIDNNLATRWDSNNNTNCYLLYDLGTSTQHSPNKIGFNTMVSDGNLMAKYFSVWTSNDNTTYTQIGIGTSTIANTGNDTIQYFELSTSTLQLGRYIKIFLKDNYSGGGLSFKEVGAYECTDCTSSTSTDESATTDNEMINDYLMVFFDLIIIGLIVGGLVWLQSKF